MSDPRGLILCLQGAVLYDAPPEGPMEHPARHWLLDPLGAGPTGLAAARRDLDRLQALPRNHALAVLRHHELGDGRLRVDLPPLPWPDRGLDALLSGNPLPHPWIRALAQGLCAQVAGLHQQGLVHGGICPALVRVRADAEPFRNPPRLLGAGWSSLWTHWARAADPPAATLRYRPPELFQPTGRGPNRQADLYAIGCILLEALTGAPLFAGEAPDALRQAILAGPRPPLRDRLGAAEAPLLRVLSRCLSAEPAERHPSATALWRELAPALGAPAMPLPTLHDPGPARRGVHPSSSASGPTPLPPARRRGAALSRTALVLGALLAALLGLVLLQAWRSRMPAREPPDRTAPVSPPPRSGPPHAGSAGSRPSALGHTDSADAAVRALPPPPRVQTDPRTTRLQRALGRVGLTEPEVVISGLLSRLFDRAAAALRRQDDRGFAEAMRPLELATHPRQCERIRREKVAYILGGIRALGDRLGRWERFRLERMLSDAIAIRGPCPRRSALLRPLVLEIRYRLAYKHARGL